MCSDAPDPDPLIGQAAMANAQLSRDAIEYFKQRDAAQAPRQAQMDALTTKLAEQEIANSDFGSQQARDLWKRYQATGIPAEDAMYRDAAEYDSKAARDKAAGQAATDVDVSMTQAADAARRNMQRLGVNPADGRALANEQDMAATGALAKADAMNRARDNRELQGIMLRKDAAAFARGMPSTAAQTFGTASAAGNNATGAVGAAMGAANATTAQMGTGFGIGMNGNSSAGSILNQEYGTRSQNSGGALEGIGQLGMGLGAMGLKFSVENMKENRAPVDGDAALQGIKNTDVEAWNYKADSPGADGGQRHIGAMAQDMQKNLGDAVAPGGKMVDLISAVGVNMAATKALAKQVDQIADKLGIETDPADPDEKNKPAHKSSTNKKGAKLAKMGVMA